MDRRRSQVGLVSRKPVEPPRLGPAGQMPACLRGQIGEGAGVPCAQHLLLAARREPPERMRPDRLQPGEADASDLVVSACQEALLGQPDDAVEDVDAELRGRSADRLRLDVVERLLEDGQSREEPLERRLEQVVAPGHGLLHRALAIRAGREGRTPAAAGARAVGRGWRRATASRHGRRRARWPAAGRRGVGRSRPRPRGRRRRAAGRAARGGRGRRRVARRRSSRPARHRCASAGPRTPARRAGGGPPGW